MRDLDPDDPRPPYQQVANALRAAILTRTFKPGDKLPSGPELATRYGVARMTVQQAVRVLRDEGLIVSRQGSGVYVRERTERPVGLRPHIERAFAESKVSIDFAGFSGETLHGAMNEPLDKVRAGRLRPDSITVRILVPDPGAPWSLPATVEDLSDSPAFRARAARIMERHTLAIVDAVNELEIESRSLTWLPLILPPTCKVLFSSIVPSFAAAGNAAPAAPGASAAAAFYESILAFDSANSGEVSANDLDLQRVARTVHQRWPSLHLIFSRRCRRLV